MIENWKINTEINFVICKYHIWARLTPIGNILDLTIDRTIPIKTKTSDKYNLQNWLCVHIYFMYVFSFWTAMAWSLTRDCAATTYLVTSSLQETSWRLCSSQTVQSTGGGSVLSSAKVCKLLHLQNKQQSFNYNDRIID